MKKKIENETLELARELFELVGIGAELEIEASEEDEGWGVVVSIDTQEHTGLLIGGKGETLSALQSFLGIALKNRLGEWVRVTVDVGDWRERQTEHLESLADQSVTRALETGEPQNLYNLNSAQRRIIHMHLSANNKVETISEGEGRERYLVIRPKS